MISSICALCSCVISIANLTFSVPSLGSHRLLLFHNSTSDYITRSIKKPLLIATSKKQGLTKKLYLGRTMFYNNYPLSYKNYAKLIEALQNYEEVRYRIYQVQAFRIPSEVKYYEDV